MRACQPECLQPEVGSLPADEDSCDERSARHAWSSEDNFCSLYLQHGYRHRAAILGSGATSLVPDFQGNVDDPGSFQRNESYKKWQPVTGYATAILITSWAIDRLIMDELHDTNKSDSEENGVGVVQPGQSFELAEHTNHHPLLGAGPVLYHTIYLTCWSRLLPSPEYTRVK